MNIIQRDIKQDVLYVCFLSPDGGGPSEGDWCEQDYGDSGVAVAEDVCPSQSERIQNDAAERLGETK